jgi:pSer/pThr/pTyr-binding forkhead associated (FHA) protein
LVDQLLLVLKVAFVVLLYLFIWRIIRVASKDVQVGQESTVLAAVRPSKPRRPVGRLLVESSNDLAAGQRLAIDRELAVGRADDAAIRLTADGYASGRHARFLRGEDRDMIEDLDSTNGTFVNGEPLHGIRPLEDGDLIAVGQTQLRYEAGR